MSGESDEQLARARAVLAEVEVDLSDYSDEFVLGFVAGVEAGREKAEAEVERLRAENADLKANVEHHQQLAKRLMADDRGDSLWKGLRVLEDQLQEAKTALRVAEAERDRYKAVVDAAREAKRHLAAPSAGLSRLLARLAYVRLSDALRALDQPVREEGEKE